MKRYGTKAAVCALAIASLGACAPMGGASLSPRAAGAHMTIAAMNMASHRAEIAEGQMALTNASAPAVREYAQRMITEHTQAMQTDMAELQQMGVTPDMLAAMPVTRQMEANHMQAMQALQPVQGTAFDRAYMDRQAAMHRYLLSSMDMLQGHAGGDAATSGAMAGAAPSGSMGSAGTGMSGGASAMSMPMPRSMDMGRMMTMEQRARTMVSTHAQHAEQIRGGLGM